MPVHLQPIPRRQFLGKSLAAAAALTLKPSLFARDRTADPESWIFFSDIHIAGDRTKLGRAINMAEHLETARADALSRAGNAAGMIISGDCAFNSGESADYATMIELLKPVREAGLPIHLALGNHDNRERFWDALPAEKAAKHPVTTRQVALLKTRNANFYVLDSLEKTLSTPGLLGPEQLTWLGQALDENQSKPAIVFVHHNLGLNGHMGLKDTEAFLDVIRPRKQVKAYVYGHTHDWHVDKDVSGIHVINLPPVAYVFEKEKPSGWVHARIKKDRLQLELRCIDTAHPQHGQKLDLAWRT